MNYCIEDLLTSGSVLIYCLKYLTSFVNIVQRFRVGAWKGFQAEEGTFVGEVIIRLSFSSIFKKKK